MYFAYRAVTFFGRRFHTVLLYNIHFFSTLKRKALSLETFKSTRHYSLHSNGLGFSPFDRLYLGNTFWFVFLWVLRCFNSPGVLHITYVFSYGWLRFTQPGCPIRKSSGQRLLVTLPRLIADCYVLHSHIMSRYPPYALISSWHKAAYIWMLVQLWLWSFLLRHYTFFDEFLSFYCSRRE